MNATERKKRVLVVDDVEDMRDFMKLALEMGGYDVVTAGSAEEAFEAARTSAVDVVIADIMMHGGPTGLDLITRIWSDLPPPTPIVIACSGFPDVEQDARRRGVWTFLTKPFETRDLVGVVDSALAGKAFDEREPNGAQRARDARNRAAAAAETFLRDLGARRPDLHQRAMWAARWVAAYFAVRHAMIVVRIDGALPIEASNDETALPHGEHIDDRLPFCRDVVETVSSVVLADATTLPGIDARVAGLPVHFFAAVPVLAPNGIGIGALCIFHPERMSFESEDLGILEHLGRSASAAIREATTQGGHSIPFFQSIDVLEGETFTELLGMELRRARRCGGSVEMAVVSVTRKCRDGTWLDGVARVARGERSALAALDSERLGLYVAATGRNGAPRKLANALTHLRELVGVRGAGVVGVSGSDVPALNEHDVLRIAERLHRNAHTRDAHVERVVIREEPWPPGE